MTDCANNSGASAVSRNAAPVIDLIEYRSAVDHATIQTVYGATWDKIGRRTSDGATCLYVRRPGASRRDAIAVKHIVALTVAGVRRLTVTPDWREAVRAQEVAMLCRQDFVEKGASAYYDPKNPNFYGYSDDERTAFESLSSGFSLVTLPVMNEDAAKFEIQYHDLHGSTWEVSGAPRHVIGFYYFDNNTLNITRINVAIGYDDTEHDISANDITQVIDLQTGVIMNGLEWAQSLPMDTAKIDELGEIRAQFRERFGKVQPKHVSSPQKPLLLAAAKVAGQAPAAPATGYRFAQVFVIAIFIFAVIASLVGVRR